MRSSPCENLSSKIRCFFFTGTCTVVLLIVGLLAFQFQFFPVHSGQIDLQRRTSDLHLWKWQMHAMPCAATSLAIPLRAWRNGVAGAHRRNNSRRNKKQRCWMPPKDSKAKNISSEAKLRVHGQNRPSSSFCAMKSASRMRAQHLIGVIAEPRITKSPYARAAMARGADQYFQEGERRVHPQANGRVAGLAAPVAFAVLLGLAAVAAAVWWTHSHHRKPIAQVMKATEDQVRSARAMTRKLPVMPGEFRPIVQVHEWLCRSIARLDCASCNQRGRNRQRGAANQRRQHRIICAH